MADLRIREEMWARLRGHMAGDVERAAFLLVRSEQDGLTTRDLRCMDDGEVDSGRRHLGLPDEVRQEMIAWAWEARAGLLEAHSHPYGDPAAFSPFDLAGLADWVPHVRWRLAGAPYVALVFAPSSVDALAFTGARGGAEPLTKLVIGDQRVAPTGLTYRNLRGRAA